MIHIIRRRLPTRFAISITRTVFSEMSTIQWRGRSTSSVSVPSDMPKPQKVRKKVSRDERRVMVESYVNKYREAHAGKFPLFSDARKQVGGSYYVLRKIIQELEYKSKISSSSSGKESLLGKELTKESESLTEVENLSTRGVQVDIQTQYDPHAVALNDVEVPDTSDKYLQTCENLMLDEDGQSDHVATQSNLLERDGLLEKSETKNVSHPSLEKVEGDQQEHPASEALRDTDGPKQKERYAEQDKYTEETLSRQTGDIEPPTTSTLWGNLKSFANGLINIWKKL